MRPSNAAFDTLATGSAAATGGAAAIHGFLYQLLATSARIIGAVEIALDHDASPDSVTAILEPRAGGDLELHAEERICIQFKHRSQNIDAGDLVGSVLPDLFRAHCSVPCDRYELQSNALLSVPAAKLVDRLAGSIEHDDSVESYVQRLRHACRAIHAKAGKDSITFGEDFAFFAARFVVGARLEISGARHALRDWLYQRLPYADRVEAEIDHLTGNLLARSASNGSTVTAGDIFDVLRLSGVSMLSPEGAGWRLRQRLEQAVRERLYDPAVDVRPPIELSADAPLTLLTGPSGRGKTWSLCSIAARHAAQNIPTILVSATSLAGLQEQMRRIIAVETLGHESPIEPSALGRLWRRFRRENTARIWVLWEGCRDVSELEQLQRSDGLGQGLLLVVELPAGHSVTGTALETVASHGVGDFSETEVFNALKARNINAGLVPKPIRHMLRLPVLNGIYASLAVEQPGWNPSNEYRVLEAYWDRARQRVGPSANHLLMKLAGQILERRRSNLSDSEVFDLGFTEANLTGLVNAGWLASISGQWTFAHDRLLTWAAAEHLVDRFERETLEPHDLSALLLELGQQHEDKRRLQRLGFMLMDVVWLVLQRNTPDARLAALLTGLEDDSEVGNRTLYGELLPSVGSDCLRAALARLGSESGSPPYYGFEGDIAACILTQTPSETERTTVLGRLAAMSSEAPQCVLLLVGAHWPLRVQRDGLWADYVERSAAQRGADFDAEHFGYLEKALITVCRADPAWLERRLCETDDVEAEWLAVHLLRKLPFDQAAPLWQANATTLFEVLPDGRHDVLIECIAQFRDRTRLDVLMAACRNASHYAANAFEHLCSLAPASALDLIRERPASACIPYGRLWLDRLLDHDVDNATTDITEWLIALDPSGQKLAEAWSEVPERLSAMTIERLLALLEARTATDWSTEDRSNTAILQLVGSLTLSPRLDTVFASWRNRPLAQRLLKQARDAQSGARNDQAVFVRRLLRRIGGEFYTRLLVALLDVPLPKALDGIRSSAFAPSPDILRKLESFAGDWDTECDDTVRIALWRALISADAETWYPRAIALLREDEPLRIHLGLLLLREGEHDDIAAEVVACVERSERGGRTEALAMRLAMELRTGSPAVFERGRERFQRTDDDNDGHLASYNAMLQDRSPEGRALLDDFLFKVVDATSFKSSDMDLLRCRLQQDDVGPELLKAAERLIGRRSLFGENLVNVYIERKSAVARNLLLETAFAPADIVTNELPDAIEALNRLDKEAAVQAFCQAWIDRPDRREYLGPVAREVGPQVLPCMIDHLREDVQKGSPTQGFRRAAIELRRHADTARALLETAYRSADLERRLALVEAIGWLPNTAELLDGISEYDAETEVRDHAYLTRNTWTERSRSVEYFRANPHSLEAMEYMIDIVDPAILCNFDDPWAVIPTIQRDIRLMMFAEAQIARRYNEVSKSKLERVRIRPRKRPLG